MIVYEIISNAASTDQGLRDHPGLMDLADVLRGMGLDTRIIQQIHSEEGEINLASGQFGQGVKTRDTTIRRFRPETHLRGIVAWLRAVAGNPHRGLHLELDNHRGTNGLPLLLDTLFHRGQYGFVTLGPNAQWERMLIQPDLTLAQVPKRVAQSPELLADYLGRIKHPHTFLPQLALLPRLDWVPSALRETFDQLVKNRDAPGVSKLSPAQVINAALIVEYHDRYARLVDQFYDLLKGQELEAESGPMFEMLTQGISLVELKLRFGGFLLEDAKSRVGFKRALLHELRIGLNQKEERREEFQKQFTSIFLRQRLLLDAPLYEKMVPLAKTTPDEIEVASPLRRYTMELSHEIQQLTGSEVPRPLRQKLFEMVVSLTFQGDYASRKSLAQLSEKTKKIRLYLMAFRLGRYDISKLQSLNPKLPVKGVAQNLSDKIPVSREEISQILRRLGDSLFPMGGVAQELAKKLRTHSKDEAQARQTRQTETFTHGAYPLITLTNYVLGRQGMNGRERQAMLGAAFRLGLNMLTSRDQIRQKTPEGEPGGQAPLQGYVLLFNREDSRLFPLDCGPAPLRLAHTHLVTRQVVRLVRRYMFQRLETLFKQFGSRLFEAVYLHVTWEHQISMSRNQLGRILYLNGVFDKSRIKEFGFDPGAMKNGRENENPFLEPPALAGEPGLFSGSEASKAFLKARDTFSALMAGYADGATPIRQALKSLCDIGLYDLQDSAAKKGLASHGVSDLLWKAVQPILSKHSQEILSQVQTEEVSGEAVTFNLPPALRPFCLLRETQVFKLGEESRLFRLRPALVSAPDQLDKPSAVMAKGLAEVMATPEGAGLKHILDGLAAHHAAWAGLIQAAVIPLTSRMMAETVLTLVRPAPPELKDIAQIPVEKVLILGSTSSEQGKFSRLYPKCDHREVYSTLSEMASWMERFPRLRQEMEGYRDLIGDILDIVSSFNFTEWDAPYLVRYGETMARLATALETPPEFLTPDHLETIESLAREISQMARDIFQKESGLRMRDRWLNRVHMRLKIWRPGASLAFVNQLFEGRASPVAEGQEGEPAARPPQGEEYQTFSQRGRDVLETILRMEKKEVFVISPAASQKELARGVIEQLYRVKGLFSPVFLDVSGSQALADELRVLIPPHRFFDLLKK
ncbi:MAG: hypothetical protein OEW12_07175 [Deltaproteobacteria bacterium]|nr:hypothetical protein [Deltaproteobacteria bacterium]